MSIIFTSPLFYWPDAAGAPLPNAQLYFYQGDTSTQALVYQDAAYTTPFTQPVRANAVGVFPPIYLAPGIIYKVALLDENGDGQWTQYPYSGAGNYYPLAWEFLGGSPPLAGEVMMMHTFDFAVSFAANFAGSAGYVITNPSAAFTAPLVDQNNTAIGAVDIDTSGGWTFTTTGGFGVTAAQYDTWVLTGPATADATVADFSGTFLGVPGQ